VDCAPVRDRLTEHALSTLPTDERAFVNRHLEWCAGCRKEAAELEAAAAVVGLSAGQMDPPASLEERVVDRVQRAGLGRGPWRRRLRVLTVATAAAVLLAVIGVGWGAAMFAQVQSSHQQAQQAERRAREITARLNRLLNSFLARQPKAGPRDVVRRAVLAPAEGRRGGAGSIVFVSPSQDDWALVIMGGLASRELPFHVTLQDRYGEFVHVGTIHRLFADGSARAFHAYHQSLKRFTYVLVKDRAGEIVLSGDLSPPSVSARS
jgi:putative zinc finger protein